MPDRKVGAPAQRADAATDVEPGSRPEYVHGVVDRVFRGGLVSAGRCVLLLQLAATVAALGWVPGNFNKLAVMLAAWTIGFRRLSRAELMVMLGIDAVFIIANSGALRNGVFRFEHPDFLGMPIYEFFMWGFYTLHTVRVIGGRPARFQPIATLMLVILFGAAFSTIREPHLLLLVSGAIVAAGLAWFREDMDFVYAGYLVAVGTLIEYVGVGTGQWAYPGAPFGGVPLWFIPMWAGVGLFTHRLLLPTLSRLDLGRPERSPVRP